MKHRQPRTTCQFVQEANLLTVSSTCTTGLPSYYPWPFQAYIGFTLNIVAIQGLLCRLRLCLPPVWPPVSSAF